MAELSKEEIVKLQDKLAALEKADAERTAALEEAESAVAELTEQLANIATSTVERPLVKIGKEQYPLLSPEVRYGDITLKLEDFVAKPELAMEILKLDAGVFGAAVKAVK